MISIHTLLLWEQPASGLYDSRDPSCLWLRIFQSMIYRFIYTHRISNLFLKLFHLRSDAGHKTIQDTNLKNFHFFWIFHRVRKRIADGRERASITCQGKPKLLWCPHPSRESEKKDILPDISQMSKRQTVLKVFFSRLNFLGFHMQLV